MSQSVVELLLKHLDDHSAAFYCLWRREGDTPGRAVAELRDIISDGVDDLEDDSYYLGYLSLALVNGVSSEEAWELGQGILHRKAKYKKIYG